MLKNNLFINKCCYDIQTIYFRRNRKSNQATDFVSLKLKFIKKQSAFIAKLPCSSVVKAFWILLTKSRIFICLPYLIDSISCNKYTTCSLCKLSKCTRCLPEISISCREQNEHVSGNYSYWLCGHSAELWLVKSKITREWEWFLLVVLSQCWSVIGREQNRRGWNNCYWIRMINPTTIYSSRRVA